MILNYAYVLVMYKNVHTYYVLFVKRASTRTAIARNTLAKLVLTSMPSRVCGNYKGTSNV